MLFAALGVTLLSASIDGAKIINTSLPAAGDNPFAGKSLYVNPSYVAELDGSITTAAGTVKTTLESMRSIASAYWLDVKSKVQPGCTNTTCAAGILADAAKAPNPPVVTLIVYDLPNRDCHAKASNGEICCTKNADGTCDYTAGGDCTDGITEYKNTYITPLASILKTYCGKVPIALVIEPDSLPNLATNQADPHCGNAATNAAYSQGIPYAINTLAEACPAATLYLDAAHGGWLGWANNIALFTKAVLAMDISSKIRGFSTNVANYQPLGTACPSTQYCLNGQHQSDPCCADPCRLEGQYNPANNEHNYVAELAASMSAGGFAPKFVVDTGRNGVPGMRADCANWCNARGAGVGTAPTTETGSDLIDAFLWLKTPGESDGCTQTLPDGSACLRYDSFCGSADSIGSRAGEPRAPEAGKWFDYEVKMLAAKANIGPMPPTPPGPPSPPPAPNGTCSACGYNCDANCNCGHCNTKPGCDNAASCTGSCNAGGNAKWCGGGGPTPPTPPPNPPPSPPPNPPSPPNNCPGGSLAACINLCPSSPPVVYKDCVADCAKRCN